MVKPKDTADIAAEIIKDYEKLKSDRQNLDAHCNEIAQRMIPQHSSMFVNGGNINKGEKRTEYIFDSTASVALDRFAAILDSLLTPRNQTWHRLRASDKNLNKQRRVRLWFDEATELLFRYRYAPKANFTSQNQQNYKSLGAYGTGCMFVDELKSEKGIRYKNIHLADICFAENHQGMVDKAVRSFKLTARQAFQQWGEMVPPRIKDVLKTNPEQEFSFLHCVKPREDVDYSRKDFKSMPYASYYVSVEGKAILDEGGYEKFPYPISRYEQAPGEVYGRSPAMSVLPAVKTLNEQKKTMLKQGHRTVDPVILAHDDGVLDSFSLKPGAINYGGVTADGRPLVHTLPVGNLSVGKDLMDDERAIINDAFLITIFQVLTETPAMTATEVMERTREKGILLAPTIGRQQSEYLGPLIERELDLLMALQVLPPMPPELIEAMGEYSIEYDSPMSRTQKAEEATGLMRTVETALTVVNVTQNPEPLDFFNWDVIMPEISAIQGVPDRWMRDVKEVMSMRAQRAQQAQAQQMIQAAPAAAAMVKAEAVAKKA